MLWRGSKVHGSCFLSKNFDKVAGPPGVAAGLAVLVLWLVAVHGIFLFIILQFYNTNITVNSMAR